MLCLQAAWVQVHQSDWDRPSAGVPNKMLTECKLLWKKSVSIKLNKSEKCDIMRYYYNCKCRMLLAVLSDCAREMEGKTAGDFTADSLCLNAGSGK